METRLDEYEKLDPEALIVKLNEIDALNGTEALLEVNELKKRFADEPVAN